MWPRAIIPMWIWGPFVLALVLGLLVSAGLYFAYLWPQVEPLDETEEAEAEAAEAAAAADADKPTTKQAAKKPKRKRAKA